MKTNGRFSLLIFFLLLFVAVEAQAQTETAVIVSDAQIIEGPEAVTLNLYFSVSGNQSGLEPANSAAILLEDGSRYQAQIEKAPYYIILVLDASGSMRPVIDDIRQAAIDLVSLAPFEAQFAVMRFAESINLVQPFTNDQNQVIQAINQVEIDDSGTCLYDVAYTAVQSLDQIARNTPRRALVLFTDGRDEQRRGTGDSCSRNTYDQLVNLAANRRIPVPIHTVGLAESDLRLNSADLSNLARATGARSAVGGSETLAQLFNDIMTDVRQQWLLHAHLLPTQGFQRGILLLNDTAQNPLPAAPVSFFSSRDYTTQPDPVTVEIRNFVYDEMADLYLFDVTLTGYETVNSLQIEVIDVQNNIQITSFPQNSPWVTQQIRLVTQPLEAERTYRVSVTPVDAVDNPLKDERGIRLNATHQFRYDPPQPIRLGIDAVQVIDEAPQFNIRTFQIEDDTPEFVINLHIENGENISHYEGVLINRLDGQQIDSFFLTVNNDQVAQTPFAAPGGAYTLIVNALGEDSVRLATADYQFIYTPPHNAFAHAWNTLLATPLLLSIFLLLLVLAILLSWVIGQAIGKRRGTRRKSEPIREPAPLTSQTIYIQVTESPDTSLLTAEPVEIVKFPYTIGREGADLSIRGDQHISRKHARITLTDGAFYIEDLGSSNGTFVDEIKIPSRDPIVLNSARGVKIRVGKTTTLSLTAVNSHEPKTAASDTAQMETAG